MSKGNTFENDLLALIFNATTIANIAVNATASPLVNLFVALHTADPGETGDQTTSECAYGSYARQSVARTSGGWTVTANSVSPFATISFPQATSGSETATHFSIGVATSGASKILYSGPLGSKQGAFSATVADVISAPGGSFSVNDRVSFYAVDGFALPTGITEGTLYWVKTVSGTDITISTTSGGSTLDITVAGIGYLMKDTTIAISSGVTPQLTTGTTITED